MCGVCVCVLWCVCLCGLRVCRGCSSPPFLAGVCCWLRWLVPRHFWLRAFAVFPRHCLPGSTASGGGLCAVYVRCVWRARSCVVVCGVLYVVPPVARLVLVFARCGSLCRGVVCICWCVVLCRWWSLTFPVALVYVCVCVVFCRVLVWVVCGICVRLACGVCVCVCVWCVGSGVRVSGYVIPVYVNVVGRHGHDKRLKKKSCKCVAFGCGRGGRSGFYPCPLPSFGVCPLCLCFASQWYLRILEVRRGVVLPVTRLFVRRCVWPYPLLAVFSRWYVSRGLPMPYDDIPHGHTLCISPIESVCTAKGLGGCAGVRVAVEAVVRPAFCRVCRCVFFFVIPLPLFFPIPWCFFAAISGRT